MRGRRVRTVVALAPILVAVLVAASVAACGPDPKSRPPDPATSLADSLGGANVPPAAFATPNPTRAAPTTTTTIRLATTATTGQPTATTDGPSGPRMLFGIGPEADQACASPLARQTPVRMLWAAGLRGFMAQLAGPTSGVDWSETFGSILVPGIGVGACSGGLLRLRAR